MAGNHFDLSPIESARKTLDETQARVQEMLVRLQERERTLAEAERTNGRRDERTEAARRERDEAEAALKAARERAAGAHGRLNEAIRGILADRPERDVARLSAEYPIVLFPVRIETRFKRSLERSDLWVRIYPDEIVADLHEPELTQAERDAGFQFWTDGWDPAKEADAWRALVGKMPPERAAWVVLQTTPTNLAARPGAAPIPPVVTLRSHPWTRAAEARLLPDRWIVLCYRGGQEVHRAVSLPVKEPLALTLSPTADQTTAVDVSGGDGLHLDPESVWTVDFAVAEKSGMALRIPLTVDDFTQGFERVLVLGVKSSVAPDKAGDHLAALLDSHHYTRGLAVVPQGTPTNNTSAAPAAYPPPDPGGANSYAVELGLARSTPGTDGARLAEAFGVPAAVTAHISHAERDERTPSRAMAEALWPVTWGYYIEKLLAPASEDYNAEAAREFYVENLRPRGHYPAFRVGGTPYGVLPVSSLQRWRPGPNDDDIARTLPEDLRRVRGFWMDQRDNAPHTGATNDPDADLLSVLGMDASTREVRVRKVLGADVVANLWWMMGLNPQGWLDAREVTAVQIAGLLRISPFAAEIFWKQYAQDAPIFRHPFVTGDPLSETEPLKKNYIHWLRTASLLSLRLELFHQDDPDAKTLLYRLLRHATLEVLRNVSDDLHIKLNGAAVAIKREPQLVKMAGVTETSSTVWERMEAPITAFSGATPLGEYILANTSLVETRRMGEHRQALQELENLPTAELERLMTETLDLASHRIDAWISALPARRLAQMRENHPLASHIGAYAWVEDLHPAPATRIRSVQLARLGDVGEQVDSGGFVLAPSMLHAATAAILRNGYLTRSGEQRNRYAVDLSSARVRKAQSLLDAVRNGQTLNAVLGYQFERGLHESHRPLQLDKYKEPFRRLYPHPTNTPKDSDEPQEAIAARDVVDGMKLRHEFTAGTIPFADPQSGLPASGPDRAAIEAELRLLDESVDCVADLLLAEGVYQIVRGSMPGAAATLDSLAKGIRPPDPEIAHLPRGGSTLAHRVALVVGGDPIPNVWPGIAATPRATAEPRLDAWVGTLLGDPANMRARVSYLDPAPGDPERRTEIVVTLAQLGLRPLDVLALAREASTQQGASETDLRVGHVALQVAPEVTDLKITYEADPAWDRATIRTFPEILEVARALNDLLGGARPLEPKDLLPAETASKADTADRMPAEAQSRALAALNLLKTRRGALDTAIAALDPPPAGPLNLAPLRDALRDLSVYGFTSAMPGSAKGNTEAHRALLVDQAKNVRDQADKRIAEGDAATTPAERLTAVFGKDFVFLPRFVPAGGAELAQAVAHGPALVSSAADVPKWLRGASRVHKGLGRLRKVGLYAEALGQSMPAIELAQLPHKPGAPWAGLTFPDEAHRHRSGLVSLEMIRPVKPAASDPWAGLMLDEWTELIPNVEESGAVAFHYDSPGAEAPQAVLIAVPPAVTEQWDLESLVATLHETLDLAKVRAVDGELLPLLSQLLPAIYLTANTADDAISTSFSGALVAENVISASVRP